MTGEDHKSGGNHTTEGDYRSGGNSTSGEDHKSGGNHTTGGGHKSGGNHTTGEDRKAEGNHNSTAASCLANTASGTGSAVGVSSDFRRNFSDFFIRVLHKSLVVP